MCAPVPVFVYCFVTLCFYVCLCVLLYISVAFSTQILWTYLDQWLKLALSKGPNRVGVSPHLRTETDPVSETSGVSSNYLESGRWTKSENPMCNTPSSEPYRIYLYLWVHVNTYLLACVCKLHRQSVFICVSVSACTSQNMFACLILSTAVCVLLCICPNVTLFLGFDLLQVKIKEKYFVLTLGHLWLGKVQFLLIYHTFNYII
jgi:hypothetical protein